MIVNWLDVENFIKELAKEIPANTSGVYGIPRGGYV